MGIKKWSNSRSHSSIQLGRPRSRRATQSGLHDDDSHYFKHSHCDSKWKAMWRKLKKHRLFQANAPGFSGQYDPDTYWRNFDEGLGCVEPENLSRSFSARFADPSRIGQTRSTG